MPKKKTHNEFINEINNLVGNEYTVLGEYINTHTKILIRHNKCGYVYYVSPTHFISGNRCPKCAGNAKGNTNTFKQDVYDLVGNEYSVLGEYVNSKAKILMKHNKCGYEYLVTPNDFKQGYRCPKCFGNIKKTTNTFKQDVYDLVGNEYSVLGEYVNNCTKILMRHNKCGYEYSIKPYRFIQDDRCPKCFGNIKKTTDIFKQDVFDLVGDEYTVLGEYVNTNIKVLMRHNKCGYEYLVAPNSFLNNGTRCPKCNESKGEKIISKFLEENNIKYNTQVSFPDCKYKRPLKFDFQIFLENNNSYILLEYDGIQHFDVNNSFGKNDDEFLINKLRDKIKDDYCNTKNIKLYRIKYTEINNIYNILNKIIK